MPGDRIVVGLGTCGIAAGGDKVMAAVKEQVAARGLDVAVDFTSCIGMCYREPMVEVALAGMPGVSLRRYLPRQSGNAPGRHREQNTHLRLGGDADTR